LVSCVSILAIVGPPDSVAGHSLASYSGYGSACTNEALCSPMWTCDSRGNMEGCMTVVSLDPDATLCQEGVSRALFGMWVLS